MLAIASAPVPMFVTYTNWGGVVVAIVWLGNVSDVGTTAIPAPAAAGVTTFGATIVGREAGDAAAVRAVVVTVSRDVTGPLRGVTVGGSNAQVVCGGRLPLAQLSVISLLYGPFCGVIVTVCVLDPPATYVADVGDTSSAKSVTTTCRSEAGPKPRPLLLAATLIVFVPAGHVIVEPGDVPQPPVHVMVVSEHELGSTKPSCAADSAAPNVVFASNVSCGL